MRSSKAVLPYHFKESGRLPIPSFTIDGVLPPFVGLSGPGGSPSDITPYSATPLEVVTHFATSKLRREILRQWVMHRELLNNLGVTEGFQWLDGSFVEDKIPSDLDIVNFFRFPSSLTSHVDRRSFFDGNPDAFDRNVVKADRSLDVFWVGLDESAQTLVLATSYYLGLFSHRRRDTLWKGMLKVAFGDVVADRIALAELDRLDTLHTPVAAP